MLLKKKSTLDRHLRNLEKQADQLRNEIKSLTKTIDHPEEGVFPPPKDNMVYGPKPNRRGSQDDLNSKLSSAVKPESLNEIEDPIGMREIRSTLGRTSIDREKNSEREPSRVNRHVSVTSFVGRRSRKVERSIQKIKAIFMMAVVVIAFYVVWKIALV